MFRNSRMKKMRVTLLAMIVFMSFEAFGNQFHNQLVKMSSAEQRNYWTNYMKKSGEDCVPTKIKFLGRDDNGGSQWSIGCKTSTPYNKEGLFVNLKASGSTQILECKYLKMLGGAC